MRKRLPHFGRTCTASQHKTQKNAAAGPPPTRLSDDAAAADTRLHSTLARLAAAEAHHEALVAELERLAEERARARGRSVQGKIKASPGRHGHRLVHST
jgi:hypothetical protein